MDIRPTEVYIMMNGINISGSSKSYPDRSIEKSEIPKIPKMGRIKIELAKNITMLSIM